jgi:alpha-galactosidase
MLYCKEGKGFLFGPVGVPTAYMTAHLTHQGEGRVVFDYAASMSGVQVAPGETRWGQQALLLAEPPNTAFVHWADWVARTHKARTDKGALSGWNSFLFHADKITGQDVLAAVEAVLEQPERLRPKVMSIDVGYEREDGQLGSNNKFPEGLAYYAQRIATTGARPGLRVNFTGPPGFDTVLQRARYAVTNGFSYLKINRTGFTNEPQALLSKTSFELMREGFMRLREAVGEETYLLYNDGQPERATVGFVDANRTGATAVRGWVRFSMDDVLRAYPLNNRWFAVDNDSYYMGTDIANVSAIKGSWPLVRTWMSMVGLSCGTASTADPWSWESFQPYLRNVEVMTPPAREVTEVLDLGTSREWPCLVGHVRRPWGDRTVALLWNPGTTERTVRLDFREIGLDPTHRYAVWSFWDNRYLGVAKGSWKTPALGPSASQHLCFTDLDLAKNKPVLIGSDLHIYCGAAEIKQVSQRRGMMEIDLTDAGAREGSLFIYSRRQPVWKAAEGCVVTGITSAGEYVWRLSIVDRQVGAPQRVTLGILLPVTRQIWFWALIATVLASLLFAAWRYVVGVRLHESHALSQERARIARDMHDVIGSRLSRLSVLGEMAIGECACSQPARLRVQEMTRGVREAAGELEHIIWAMDPKNDTLSELVNRVCQEAEEFFAETPVQCHFETLPEIPPVVLRPEVRSAVGNAVKEALANVLKHASATVVELAMQVDGDTFQIKIIDNGVGFDPSITSSKTTGGYGLSNMRSRLEAMGGECRIESAPGRGTSVFLRWPLGKHLQSANLRERSHDETTHRNC